MERKAKKARKIHFDNFDELLTDYFVQRDLPTELGSLPTHSTVGCVEVDELTSVEVANGEITIDGYATISVGIQNGSDSDMSRDESTRSIDSFPMSFSAKLEYDEEYSIESVVYEIDTSSYYEYGP